MFKSINARLSTLVDPAITRYIPKGMIINLIFLATTMFIAQGVYAWQLWIVSLRNNVWLPILTATAATGAWGK
ncbi:hypothetical protein VKT23_009743 [Stygiomarasmius scandens]|uniref:Uncharacterized protein n=1 Tax=Marasmiellus scandens TaxID=2682957 RepID=A0ABR1JJ53_9AGAR